MFMHGAALEARATAPGAAADMLEAATRGAQPSSSSPPSSPHRASSSLLPADVAIASASDPSREHIRALRSSARTSREYLSYLTGDGGGGDGKAASADGGATGGEGAAITSSSTAGFSAGSGYSPVEGFGSVAQVARQLTEQQRHLVRLALRLATGRLGPRGGSSEREWEHREEEMRSGGSGIERC